DVGVGALLPDLQHVLHQADGAVVGLVKFTDDEQQASLLRRMTTKNFSVTEFILAGLTDQPGLRMPLFFLFLGFYMVTMLSCNSTFTNELVVFIVVAFDIGVPIVTIFISYALILSSILHMHSKEGRSKAFSTCSSHMI
ncbi:hypothetical protein A6R68_11644, partial [Neotoma lepida]